MNIFKQYLGMRRELYIIFWGRVVTSMGALIWPMMTLILKNKLGYTALEIAQILMILGWLQLPCTIIGGKMADHFNKRNLIIACDLVTVISYFICAFLPVSNRIIPLLALAAIFAAMEGPSYDAIVADFSTAQDRERAYSLNYLGYNLGMVLAPALGGFLFANHLNLAFFISSVATASSTILIYLFIKDVTPSVEDEEEGQYEQSRKGQSLWRVLRDNPLMGLFILCGGLWLLVYSQFNFLLPLNLEQLYGEQGAVWFGVLTSVNAIVVIIGTPLLTRFAGRLRDADKLLVGQVFVVVGFSFYIFFQGVLALYVVSMVIFTIGEIIETLGRQPYLTRRIPASHRGRFVSWYYIFGYGFQLWGQQNVGGMADQLPMTRVWTVICIIGAVNVAGYLLLRTKDSRAYPLIYKQ